MLKRSVVAFLDLLGFSAAVNQADAEAFKAIYHVLQRFSNSNANFKNKVVQHSPSRRTTYSSPAVSSFSDHVIISQPVHVEANDGLHDEGTALYHIQHLVAEFFYSALQNGLLVRGGITIGDIHHDQNIVFGKPVIEAVKIETELAIYPRILVSESLLSLFKKKNMDIDKAIGPGILRRDYDGLYYVDWINDTRFKLCNQGTYDGKAFAAKINPIKPKRTAKGI
jgi:hypothetical protein